MSAKFKGTKLVYSTNPDFNQWDESEKEEINLKPEQQQLYISLDKKQRRGKKVTLVTGFLGSNDDLKELGKILKSKCGVGGSSKDDQIIIQGDFKNKIVEILTDLGYKCKLIGG
jgi:translation initiation factor 1